MIMKKPNKKSTAVIDVERFTNQEKKYGNQDKLISHENLCKGKQPSECNLCHKMIWSNLTRHVNIKHKVTMGSGENFLLVENETKK